MSLEAGPLRIGGAGQSCNKKKEVSMATPQAPPPGTLTLNHSVEYLQPILK